MFDDAEHENLQGQINLDRAEREQGDKFLGEVARSIGEKVDRNSSRLDDHGAKIKKNSDDIVALQKAKLKIYASWAAFLSFCGFAIYLMMNLTKIKAFFNLLG
jgi:hypothetical protein